jgi:hypothetical protein
VQLDTLSDPLHGSLMWYMAKITHEFFTIMIYYILTGLPFSNTKYEYHENNSCC